MNGYGHALYAESFREFGVPRELPRSGGRILVRPIPGSVDADAMGCYPLFVCSDWSKLPMDLAAIGGDLVSVTVVTDPFGDTDAGGLHAAFNTMVRPFKEHFVVDLKRSMATFVDKHHLRNAKQAMNGVRVEHCEPGECLHEFVGLYDNLIRRHGIHGMTAFSQSAFACQFGVPGLVVFRACTGGITVGMLLWYIMGEVGYYHLGAYSDRGYELKASFALFKHAIEYFAATGIRWLNLGAGAGATNDGADGLTRFKRGWATGTRVAYLCGHIGHRERYATLCEARRVDPSGGYFPGYRAGEFA